MHREGHSGAFLMARAFGFEPAVMFAMVARIGLIRPRMRQRTEPGRFRFFDIEPEWGEGFVAAIGLKPDWISIRQLYGARIIEATDTPKCAINMIKRPVFLHQDDHVLRVHETRAWRRINRESPANGFREQQPAGAGQGGLFEKFSSRDH